MGIIHPKDFMLRKMEIPHGAGKDCEPETGHLSQAWGRKHVRKLFQIEQKCTCVTFWYWFWVLFLTLCKPLAASCLRKGLETLAPANPWKFIMLANSKGASFSRGALACLLTCLPCKAHCECTHHREAGARYTILISQCVCVCKAPLCPH